MSSLSQMGLSKRERESGRRRVRAGWALAAALLLVAGGVFGAEGVRAEGMGGGATAGRGQDQQTNRKQGTREQRLREAMTERLDKDGDGQVSDEERRAARESFRIKRFDKDGDGVLSDEERAEAARVRAERMKQLDTDGDGRISPEERRAPREKHRAMLDADGDGVISKEEREMARERREARNRELLQKYDTDGDGRLSYEERGVAWQKGEKIGRGVPPVEERSPNSLDD